MEISFLFVVVGLFGFVWCRFVGGGLGFSGVLGFDEILQVREAGAPEGSVLLDPVVDGAERFGIEFVDAVATLAMFADQVGAAEEAQVLGDGGAGDGKGSGDLSGGLAAAAKEVEDGTASGIGQGMEGGFLGWGGGICNRTVTHNA
jgi:hypothetical protein